MYHYGKKRNVAFRGLSGALKKYSVKPHARTMNRLRTHLRAAPNRKQARTVLATFLSQRAPTKRVSTNRKMVAGYMKRRYYSR